MVRTDTHATTSVGVRGEQASRLVYGHAARADKHSPSLATRFLRRRACNSRGSYGSLIDATHRKCTKTLQFGSYLCMVHKW
jgi:hypothetical protein